MGNSMDAYEQDFQKLEGSEAHEVRQVARTLHHDMSMNRELSQPFLNSVDGRRLAQFRVLQFTLLLLGWFPKQTEMHCALRVLVVCYQFLIAASMSFGFYSISGATEETMGSNVMGTCVDFVYPLVWLASLAYFRTHHLAESLGRVEKNNRAPLIVSVSSIFILISFIMCVSWAMWQKSNWWVSLPESKKNEPYQYGLLILFTATLALRLFSVCVVAIVVYIICYEHKLGVDCFLRAARARNVFIDSSATGKLLRQHMLLCDELSTTGKQLGYVMAMLLLTSAVCCVILMVGLYLDLITFSIFMNTASDFFLCFGFSMLLIAVAASTSRKHGSITPMIMHHFWSQPHERVSADQMMQVINYFTTNQAAFRVVGIRIDDGTISKLVSFLVSFFGLIALRKFGTN